MTSRSLSDSNFVPKIGYVVAIHGLPYWFTSTSDKILPSFPNFANDGGTLIPGLIEMPTITTDIDVMGGIGNLNDLSIKVLETEDNILSGLFLGSSVGLSRFWSLSGIGRADTDIIPTTDGTEVTVDGFVANQILQFPREAMMVSVVNAGSLTVIRSMYSAFHEGRWNEKFTKQGSADASLPGVPFLLSNTTIKGHYTMNGRWVVVYRISTNEQGEWGLPKRIYAGVMEGVNQVGGEWTIKTKSVMAIMGREINNVLWNGKIKSGWWMSGAVTDYYDLRLYVPGSAFTDFILTYINGGDTGKTWEEIQTLMVNREGAYDGMIGYEPEFFYRSDHAISSASLKIRPDSGLFRPLRVEETATGQDLDFDNSLWFGILGMPFANGLTRGWSPATTFIAANAVFYIEDGESLWYQELVSGDDYDFLVRSFDGDKYFSTTYNGSGQFTIDSSSWTDSDGGILTGQNRCAFGDDLEAQIIIKNQSFNICDHVKKLIISTGNWRPAGLPATTTDYPGWSALGIPTWLVNQLSFLKYANRYQINGTYAGNGEPIQFSSLVADDLKLMGLCLTWSQSAGAYWLALSSLETPSMANVVYDLDETEIISRTPTLDWGYISPLNKVEMTWKQGGSKYTFNICDQDSMVGSTRSVALESKFLADAEIPVQVIGNIVENKLRWLSTNVPKFTLELPRSIWENINISDCITVSHPMIVKLSSSRGYGLVETPCIVIAKTEGKDTSIDVLLRSNLDLSLVPLLAPSLEVDLLASGCSSGYHAATSKLFLKHTFSRESASYDLQYWASYFRSDAGVYTPYFRLRWYDTQGTLGGRTGYMKVSSLSGTQNYLAIDDTWVPEWRTLTPERVMLTIGEQTAPVTKDFGAERFEEVYLDTSMFSLGYWLDKGLIGHYRLDEYHAGLIAKDECRRATLTSIRNLSLYTTTLGKLGRALNFVKGSNDGIIVTNLESAAGQYIDWGKPFSIAMWVKLDDTTGYKALFSDGNLAAKFTAPLFINGTTLCYGFGIDALNYYNIKSNEAVAANAFYHLVMTYNGSADITSAAGNVELWKNGVKQSLSTSSKAGSIGASTALGATKYIGGGCVALNSYDHDGIIEAVSVFNRQISAAEIDLLYRYYLEF
jgi:hypothetical protein